MFGHPTTRPALQPLVGDLRQLASVRRIMLDDGGERDVRAMAFSSGGGLDFWALADRTLDIGPLWFRGTPVAWQGAAGFINPALIARNGDQGRGIERGFSGLLVTCGLDHIRTSPDAPLHGLLPFTPGRVSAYGEDWDRPVPVLFCEGEVTQWRLGGEGLRLHRRIEVPVGGTTLLIQDRVENLSPAAVPVALLYHVNFGFPVVQPGSALFLDGRPVPMPDAAPACLPVGPGEATVVLTAPVPGQPFEASLTFGTASLPFLQLWRNPMPGTAVLAVEPCTSDRGVDGRSGPETPLAPGECREFRLQLGFAAGSHGQVRPPAMLDRSNHDTRRERY